MWALLNFVICSFIFRIHKNVNIFAVYQSCRIICCPIQRTLFWIICMGLYSKLPVVFVVSLPQCLETVHALESNVVPQYFFLMLLYKRIRIWPESMWIQPIHSLFCYKLYVHCKVIFVLQMFCIQTFLRKYILVCCGTTSFCGVSNFFILYSKTFGLSCAGMETGKKYIVYLGT